MDMHDHNSDGPIWHPDSDCQQYHAETFADGMEVVSSATAKRIAKIAGIEDTTNCTFFGDTRCPGVCLIQHRNPVAKGQTEPGYAMALHYWWYDVRGGRRREPRGRRRG
jgi:hypothetical protein